MRRLAFPPAMLVLACMSPVEAETLRYEDAEWSHDTRAVAIPDGVPVTSRPREVAAPEVAAPARGTTRYRMTGHGTEDDCISVRSEGFPAIDRTGELVAVSQDHWLQDTPLAGSTALKVISIGDERVADQSTTILPPDMDTMDGKVCRALRKQVRSKIQGANTELAARGFRPLDVLAVEIGDPEVPADVYLDTPARERPLQVLVQHGEAIARIPGVRVYERQAIEGGRGARLYAVHGDRSTGAVVLTFASCEGESCTCDPLFTAEVVRWSEETFAALDAHPCGDPEAEDGRCHAGDLGF